MVQFVNLIPHEALDNLLEKQVAENEQFAKFYGVIRKPAFRTNVMDGFVSIRKLWKFQFIVM